MRQLVKKNDRQRYDILGMMITGCLLLSAMNFGQKYFYFFFAAFIMQLWMWRGKLRISHASLLYIAFSCIRGISEFVHYGGNALVFVRQLAFGCAFIFGLNANYGSGEQGEKTYLKYAIVFASGMLIHYVLNWVLNMSSAVGRNTIDIWSGEVLAATGQAMIACIPLGICASMVLNGVNQRQRIISALGLVCIMAYNLILSGRTIIFLCGILLVINWVWIMGDKRRKENRGFSRKYTVLIILVIGAIVLLTRNQHVILESNLFERLAGIDSFFTDTRGSQKATFLNNMFNYPFGGYHLRNKFGYAHDLLLDTYAESGMFSLFILLGILSTSAYDVYFLVRNNSFTREFRIVVLSVFVSIWVFFLMEPVLVGGPWLFVIYSFLSGGLHEIIKNRLRRNCNEGTAD